VFAAFLASILIQLIRFGHWVGQGCGRGEKSEATRVYLVPAFQKMGAISECGSKRQAIYQLHHSTNMSRGLLRID
jgi:hypothetical protein